MVLLCTHYEPLQCLLTYFRKLQEIGVLRPIFRDYVISCDYVCMKKFSFNSNIWKHPPKCVFMDAIWKSRHRHLSISIVIGIVIGIGVTKKLFFPSEIFLKK